jgi:hypothetical protein
MDERTLDRQIAERQGWHGFHTRKDWYEHPEIGPYESERLMGTDANGHEREVPAWASDLNAALDLIVNEALQERFSLCGDRGEWEVSIAESYASIEWLVVVTAPTPAEAVCAAYLEYTATDTATPGEGVG